MIKIIGLGPGAKDALTIGAFDALKESKQLYFRTEKHPTVDYLKTKIENFFTYDKYYEECESFDEVYLKIANDIIENHKIHDDIVYAVPGHPLVAEKSVVNLIELCEKENVDYKILPAVSFVDAMMDRLRIDPINGLKIIDAFDIKNQILDKRIGTIITQVYNNLIASEVKLQLLEYYNGDTKIIYVRAAGIEGEESIREIELYELDMQEDIDYLTSIYIPKDINNKKDYHDLINIIDILRGDDGCSWDREQNHKSLKNALIEECYEVVEAIDNDDIDGLIEELGDVLLHVVFHGAIGAEDGYFNNNDIIEAICKKMISRHPHVFNKDSKEKFDTWEELKVKEKKYETLTEEMEGIAKTLPSLIRASKVQKKASKVGFDLEDIDEAIKCVESELEEVKDVYKSNDKEKILLEIGDLLFSCVNVARFLDVNEEEALNETIKKFIYRFSIIEKTVLESGKNLKEISLDEMNELWEKSKNRI